MRGGPPRPGGVTTSEAGAKRSRPAQSEMADWVPFHQQEALTTRLANILEEYPVGVGSLREFVQNADAAGAHAHAAAGGRGRATARRGEAAAVDARR